MDIYPVVEAKLDDGRRLLAELIRRGLDLAAAGWLQTTSDGKPYLYLMPADTASIPPGGVYEVVDAAVQAIQPSRLSLFEVKAVASTHPVARALIRYVSRYPGDPSDATIYPQDTFLGIDVQQPVFVYALPAHAPAA